MTNTTNTAAQPMSKEAWIEAATARLLPYMPDGTREYAESLYQTFVVDFDDPDCTPTEAVDEDLSNWGD